MASHNIYTNDQPEFDGIRRFIYAGDLCLAAQARDFVTIERRLSDALNTLTEYYRHNSLNANPGKTQVCAFHLNNHQADRKLNISWNGNQLENDSFPVYLYLYFLQGTHEEDKGEGRHQEQLAKQAGKL